MEKGIMILLKALGIEITPEQIAMIQALIPQLPGKINSIITAVNNMVQNSDERLRANEEELKKLRAAIENLTIEISKGQNAVTGNV